MTSKSLFLISTVTDEHRLPNVKGDVRSVKMWRKDDFDRLVEKAKKLGIVVEPKE
jgi:hypothetical protein